MSIFKNNPESVFVLGTQKACEKAIKYGWIAALISAGITLIAAVLGFFVGFFVHSENSLLQYLLDPALLVDVILIVILAFFIYKKSRVASTLMLVYFMLSQILVWMDTHAMRGWGVAIILIILYFNAMRATYIWHSKYKNPPQQEATVPVDTDENK